MISEWLDGRGLGGLQRLVLFPGRLTAGLDVQCRKRAGDFGAARGTPADSLNVENDSDFLIFSEPLSTFGEWMWWSQLSLWRCPLRCPIRSLLISPQAVVVPVRSGPRRSLRLQRRNHTVGRVWLGSRSVRNLAAMMGSYWL